MPLLDRYLGRIILQYTALSMAVLLGLFVFVNFLDQTSDIGKGDYGLREALWYITLTIPRIVYELFPMATLIGTIIGLSLLASDSELIAMRASGVSVAQITVAALKMGGLFVIAVVLVGELIAPPSETLAQRNRAAALQQNIDKQTDSGLWMRDAQTYFNAGEVLPDLTLLNIKIFEFNADQKLRELLFAANGKFENDGWTFNKVKKTIIGLDGDSKTEQQEKLHWPSTITPKVLSIFLLQPERLSLLQLHRHIRHLENNQQQTAPYQLAFWSKLMLPLSVAVMVVLAIPFVFANIRSGTLGRSLFIGIMTGLGFYAVSKSFGYIALAYSLPPLLGAALPLIAFLLLAAAMIKQIK